VVYESSYGLAQGDIVTISDIRVGHVTKVDLTDDGRALVTFRILARHAGLIGRSSRALLRQKNILFGDWLIALTTDSAGLRGGGVRDSVSDHDTLKGVPPMRLDRVISQLTSMVGTFEGILQEVGSGQGLLGALVTGDSLVDAVYGVVADFRTFARAAKRTAVRLDGAGERFGKLGDRGTEALDSLVGLMDSLGPAISEARRLLVTLGDASGHLSPMFEQAQVDLEEIEVLLKGLQKHWLFRRSVDKEKAERNGAAGASEPPAAP